ncbi:hypothetical protein B0I27_103453 [Arcticibacter pallidicorallinus]|uniref:Uncharacterized protein n=1 Tax=Arcticibacter pallidicorallinus TaxID=1259464 RepID=A0A2T0U7T5_9SPHI|nr:pyridoxamine 5'-phosphate oxidase family protein [Arcticibacter pallidicorallinus]PRY53980.1 hypothetical protein B0I27_103453 [Arcticibacter pallidicorallinus]
MEQPTSKQARPDQLIASFFKAQTVFTLATSAHDQPYCSTCFYAYSEEYNMLVFKSSEHTDHIQQALLNNLVGGSVLPDKLQVGKIKGIQFKGKLVEPESQCLSDLKKTYYAKYPFALAMGGEIWIIELSWIKFTDNTLGFGKKIKWERP